jgi:hypothetical protein
MKTNYLSALKQMVLSHLGNENVKVLLFGSRARNDNHPASDVDIAIVPGQGFDRMKITLLKEKIENSTIPYKVEIVNLAETSDDFRNEIMKDAIVWKE